MESAKILVAQGGGLTAVIKQSLGGVALEARLFGQTGQIGQIFRALHGERGMANEKYIDLTQETSHNLVQVANTPSSALGSSRDKPDAVCCHEVVKVLHAHQIGHFFYIGYNDPSDTVRTGYYSVDCGLLPLRTVAGKTRTMEDEFSSANGTDMTDSFRPNLRPLLRSGMPDAFSLRHHPVAKVLHQ